MVCGLAGIVALLNVTGGGPVTVTSGCGPVLICGLGGGGGSFGLRPSGARVPSFAPIARVAGLQLAQCWVSSLGDPSAYEPTRILMHDDPSLSLISKGPSKLHPRFDGFPFLT